MPRRGGGGGGAGRPPPRAGGGGSPPAATRSPAAAHRLRRRHRRRRARSGSFGCSLAAVGALAPGYGVRLTVATLARVLLHRLVDEVVDAAFELARHLLERLPEHVAALERARALLVRIRAHRRACRQRAVHARGQPECTELRDIAQALAASVTCPSSESRQNFTNSPTVLSSFGSVSFGLPAFGTSHARSIRRLSRTSGAGRVVLGVRLDEVRRRPSCPPQK